VHQGERIAVRIFEERHSGLIILQLGDQVKLDRESGVALPQFVNRDGRGMSNVAGIIRFFEADPDPTAIEEG
jgi:hypothetical protein